MVLFPTKVKDAQRVTKHQEYQDEWKGNIHNAEKFSSCWSIDFLLTWLAMKSWGLSQLHSWIQLKTCLCWPSPSLGHLSLSSSQQLWSWMPVLTQSTGIVCHSGKHKNRYFDKNKFLRETLIQTIWFRTKKKKIVLLKKNLKVRKDWRFQITSHNSMRGIAC